MNRLWQKIGIVSFYLLWPLLYMALRYSDRTRVYIRYKDKVLCVRTWLGNGKWQLPGGGRKLHESAAKAAVREVQEETGLSLRIHNIASNKYTYVNDGGFRYRATIFIVDMSSADHDAYCRDMQVMARKNPFEIIDVQWVDIVTLRTETSAQSSIAQAANLWKTR
jgi:8-oxo-dGTP pyrophosphatase MutT (NUDIX family)